MGFHAGEVLRPGDLHIALRAGHQRHGQARGLEQGGIVGGAGIPGAMGLAQRGVAEGLRRLGAEQSLSWHRLHDAPVRAALERVRHGLGRDGAGGIVQRGQQGRDGAGRDDGTCGVMHQHDVGRVGRQRLQPGTHAGRAGGAAGDGGQHRQAGKQRGHAFLLPRRDDRQQAIHPAFAQQRLGGVPDLRAAGKG